MATTTQKKNTTMPGMAYPATVLALLAMAASYPLPPDLFGGWLAQTGLSPAEPAAGRRNSPACLLRVPAAGDNTAL
jgi:hypothetical protein